MTYLRLPLAFASFTIAAFAQIWEGTTSSDWNTATNWSTGAVPTNTGNTVISSNGSNAPQITATNAITNRTYLGYGYTTTTLTIDGVGSNWSNSTDVYIAYTFGANVSVSVTNGATVNVGGVTILGEGGASNTNATLTINGSGSEWTNTGALTIGSNYRGTVQLQAGGSLSSSGASIGLYNLSNWASVASLSGASSWENNGTLVVGGAGKAELNIADTSSVQNTGLITIANSATANASVTMTGGLLEADAGIAFGSGTGTFNLNGGTLHVGGNNGIQSGAGSYTFNLGGGKIEATGSDLTTSVSATLANATTSTIGADDHDATFSGVLSGTGALRKTGAGTLTLSGANTFSGGMTVDAGTLLLASSGGNSAVGTGALFIDTAATLTGTGIVSGSTTVAGTLAPGEVFSTLTFTSDLTLMGTSLTQLDIASGSVYDQIHVSGNLTMDGTLSVAFADGYNPVSGATFMLFNSPNAFSGTFSTLNLAGLGTGLTWDTSQLYNNGTLSVVTSAIPEPSTYALFAALSALGVAWVRRKRRA